MSVNCAKEKARRCAVCTNVKVGGTSGTKGVTRRSRQLLSRHEKYGAFLRHHQRRKKLEHTYHVWRSDPINVAVDGFLRGVAEKKRS